MKKLIVGLFLSLSLFVSTLQQSQAAALAISASGGSGVAQVLFGMSALSMTLGCISDGLSEGELCASAGKTNGLGGLGIVLVVFGIIVLEGDQQFSLSELSSEQAKQIGLNDSEVLSFNNNIEELNLMMTSSLEEIVAHGTVSDAEALTIVKSHGEDVDGNAFSAFMKLRSFNARIAQKSLAQ